MRHKLRSLPLICVILLFLSCGSEANEVEWKEKEYVGDQCPDCPSVNIRIPEGPEDNRLARQVKTSLEEEIIYWLDYAESNKAGTIREAMASFTAGYTELQEKFPEETAPWEADIQGQVAYSSPLLLCISLEGYLFTGGAHGYSSLRYLNFDAENARELDPAELFVDLQGFTSLAEAAFRKQYEVPPSQDINSTGFMFEDNQFSLPESIGFGQEGVLLHYDPYEVASYADGPLSLSVPYSDAAPYLNPEFSPVNTTQP